MKEKMTLSEIAPPPAEDALELPEEPARLESARTEMEGCDDSEWANYMEGLVRQHERYANALRRVAEGLKGRLAEAERREGEKR